MADLQKLRDFAADNDFGLTVPLTARQARELAEYWLPDLNFHEDERFHPIALSDRFDMVESHLASMPPATRDQWRVGVRQRGVDANGQEIAEVPHGTWDEPLDWIVTEKGAFRTERG